MWSKRTALGLLLMACVLVTGCIKSAEPRQIPTGAEPEPTPSPIPVRLPDDEQLHDSRLEWWYHSGHLESETGREFGFHFVVFKAQDDISEPNFVAQLGILDVDSGKHYEFSRAEAGFRQVGGGVMTMGIADWVYGLLPFDGGHSFTATSGEFGLSLDLEATTPVMLHNDIGWFPTEIGGSYYYSWPRQETVGELTLEGEKFRVTGTTWFDHQWGDFFVLGKPSGWQWFAIQLADGGSLMITESRGSDGEIVETYGTHMSPSGEVSDLRADSDGIELVAVDEWRSPDTGGIYPSGWALNVDSLGLDLELVPVILDQEVEGGLPAASTYWEGKVRVEGTQFDKPIEGDAYVELLGYVDPDPIEWMQRR